MKITALVILFFYVFINSSNDYVKIQDARFEKGKKLFFKEQCSSCHSPKMRKVATASALGGITKRRDKKWLYAYTRNPSGMVRKGDKTAKEIAKKAWGLMPSYPKITDKELDDIYYFVEKTYAAKPKAK
jgi:mono/diheme cytochrome c family protein